MSATTNNMEELFQRGFDLRCEGRYGEARMILQSLLAKNPNHIDAKHQLALIQGFEGDFDGSVASLSALSLQSPRNLEILYDLAMTQMMIGESDAACGNFRKILSLDPRNDKASKQVIYC